MELGGTRIVVATGRGVGSFERCVEVPTRDPASTPNEVRSAVDVVTDGHPIAGLGIASFGPIDLRTSSDTYGELLSTPKTGWTGVNVVEEISRDVEAPVGVTIPGVVVHGASHPEIDHIRVPRHKDDHYMSSCPFHEDRLEGMASGTAVRERWGARAEDLGHLTVSATQLEAWYLARGIAGLCAIIPVELVIIGGGVSKFPGLHDEVARALEEASGAYPPVPFAEGGPTIVAPGLGDDAGVIGAIEFARIATGESVAKPVWRARRSAW